MDPASSLRNSAEVSSTAHPTGPSNVPEPAILNETPPMGRPEQAYNLIKEAAEFITPGVTCALVGIIGIATLPISVPVLAGFIMFDAGKAAHKKLLNKVGEQGFATNYEDDKKMKSPIFEFCKANAVRVAGEFKNVFTQRLWEHLPIASFDKTDKASKVSDFEETISSLNEYVNNELNIQPSSFISRSDLNFCQTTFGKSTETLKDFELNRLANIATKVENRILAYEKMTELEPFSHLDPKDKEELEGYKAKMSTFPQRPLSENEINRVFKIYDRAAPQPPETSDFGTGI